MYESGVQGLCLSIAVCDQHFVQSAGRDSKVAVVAHS